MTRWPRGPSAASCFNWPVVSFVLLKLNVFLFCAFDKFAKYTIDCLLWGRLGVEKVCWSRSTHNGGSTVPHSSTPVDPHSFFWRWTLNKKCLTRLGFEPSTSVLTDWLAVVAYYWFALAIIYPSLKAALDMENFMKYKVSVMLVKPTTLWRHVAGSRTSMFHQSQTVMVRWAWWAPSKKDQTVSVCLIVSLGFVQPSWLSGRWWISRVRVQPKTALNFFRKSYVKCK